MKRLGAMTAVMVLVTAGALAGCRGTDSGGGGGSVKTDVGVTAAPCPQAIDKNKGCIYLGIISDLTVGPFKALAVPITDSQKAFWKRVNTNGGIGGKYEVDVTTYVRDNKYDPQTHNQVYQEIKGKVLGLAQTLGSPTTAAIIEDLEANNIVAAPASWTSAWAFRDVILESGANYCIESMNAIDYAKETFAPKSVMSIHYAGDYGDDAAAGAKYAAEKLGLTFANVVTTPGATNQAGAVAAVVAQKPELVILTTAPAEAAAIVGGTAVAGYKGHFIGTSPTWNPALNGTAAAPALAALYLQSGPWQSWGANTPGHVAMRAALGTPTPLSDGYTAGWVWSYPMKAALDKAVANGDLTRKGLLAAAKSLESVDYEGMLPAAAGNYKAGAAGQVKTTVISKPDKAAPTGVTEVKAPFTGPTAEGYTLSKPCYTP